MLATILQVLENEMIRLLFAVSLLPFFSWYLRNLENVKSRRIFSTVVGTILQIFVFGILPVFKICIFSSLMFAITKFFPQRCGMIVTILSMIYLSYYHLYGLILRYGQNVMDQGVLVMILVCKYSLFAYACQDGNNPKKQITTQKQKSMIQQNVSILQFFEYLQFLPTAIVGPPIEYQRYKKYIRKQSPFDNIPSPKSALIQNAKQFICCAIIFTIQQLYVPTSYVKTQEFFNRSPLYIIIYTFLAMVGLRFKYYSGWKLSMFSLHTSGISYQKQDDNFKGVNHCNVMIVQTSPHIRDKIGNWNITVQQWLRKCVYERSPFKNKMYSSLYVFMVSAFWHGYYIGLYLSFFTWFVQTYLQTLIFKLFRSGSPILQAIQQKIPIPLMIVATILANLLFSQNAIFFYFLEWNLCLRFMKKMLFIPQILPILGIIILSVIKPKKPRIPKQTQKKQT